MNLSIYIFLLILILSLYIIYKQIRLFFKISIYNIHSLQLRGYKNLEFLKFKKNNLINFQINFSSFIILLFSITIYLISYTTLLFDSLLISSIIYFIFAIFIWHSFKKISFLENRLKYKIKKQLVYTNRIKRFLFFFVLFVFSILFLKIKQIIIINIISYYLYNSNILLNLVFSLVMLINLLSILLIFNKTIIIIINLLSSVIEWFIKWFYIFDAKRILRKYNGEIIGITGSYGKTSTKNIIYDILKNNKLTLKTPGSFNTTMGVIITIRTMLENIHENFIVEMGAKYKKDIKEIAKFVKPKISIVTNVGNAHLETLKTKENILKTKMQIVENLDKNGIAILNYDNQFIKKYKILRKDIKKITYGIENKKTKFSAQNIKSNLNGTSFDFISKDKKIKIKIKTKLLGKHNVYNIMAGIIVALEQKIPIEEIQKNCLFINQIEHRLERKEMYGFDALDDSFNSNPEGAKEAINIISSIKNKYKVLITPGMVELGKEQEKEDFNFGKNIANSKLNHVILIGENKTKNIIKGIDSIKNKKMKIEVVDSFNKAIEKLKQIKKENIICLFENDLPID